MARPTRPPARARATTGDHSPATSAVTRSLRSAQPGAGSPSRLWRPSRISAGSGCSAMKSSCRPACVAMPRSHLSSAETNHSRARLFASARSMREGTPVDG
eukprot:1229403-Lingulodinium_polyedra.AAC.1